MIPRRIQILLRMILARLLIRRHYHQWPIDSTAVKVPSKWRGWPNGKRFALVLTHDVDTQRGHDHALSLMKIERELGFRSSFYFVPERYGVSPKVRETLTGQGFEVGVHGLNHDGKLYQSHELFLNRAERINGYIKDWGAVGFRSPAMHHNLEWLHALNIEYDASTFDTDPIEPQSDGMGTIFPFWVPAAQELHRGYVELPYTLPQDFSLFILLGKTDTRIWKRKLDWIVDNGGMALILTHPDYMHFENDAPAYETYPVKFYSEFLHYISEKYSGLFWQALPCEIAHYVKSL
jgi:peptidoglycan/xylan/chitin deacetylase (PgdA/CDA1 family)